MRRSVAELVGRTLLTATDSALNHRTWNPSLEQSLHKLKLREFLTPPLVTRVIDSYLHNHHSLAYGFFNWVAQQPGFSHTSDTCKSLFKSLSASRQFNLVDKVFKQVKLEKIPVQPSVYRFILGSLIAGRKTQLAFSVFCDLGPVISEIGFQVCNSLLAVLASVGSIINARKVFDEMVNRGVRLSTLGFGVFIWEASRSMSLAEIFGLLNEARNSNFSGIDGSIIALLVIQGLCSESRCKDAVHALEELRKKDCKPDFMAYRNVAEKLREMGFVVDVEMILKKKRKLGVAPRANDYKQFILELVSMKLMHQAKQLGEVIISGNFAIEDDVLNVLIGSVSGVDTGVAISFLMFMIDKGRFPTLLTLINLSENLCRCEKADDLVHVFQILSAKDYFKNLESNNVMISFLCKAGRVKEGYKVLDEMRKKGLVPDISCYNSLLDGCCQHDLLRPAKRLWDEMFANGCRGNLESYRILIGKFSEVGEMEDACHLLNHMIGRGLEPDELIYKSLVQGLSQTTNTEMAVQILNKYIQQVPELAKRLEIFSSLHLKPR